MVLVGQSDPMTTLYLSDHVLAAPGYDFANSENCDYKTGALSLGFDYALGAASLRLTETLT